MKSLAVAIGFLTRIPVNLNAGPDGVGRSVRWFPLVGAGLGAVSVAIQYATRLGLPASVVAVLIVMAEAVLTGALHMDGLADTVDGFGGGRTRDDVLRIMRDSAIGSYGAVALILLIALQVTAIAALIGRRMAVPFLLLAPALGRWSIVPLARFLPYARPSESVAGNVGTMELLWASIVTTAIAVAAAGWRGLACGCAVAGASAVFGWLCHRRIGGVTGDTLGAAVQISQGVVFLTSLLIK